MPEYLAPGVYIEETSYRAKSIEGVATSTTGFVGPTLWGPTTGPARLVTSLTEFSLLFGGLQNLTQGPNYLAHAARAYFENGGRRLYVARVMGSGSNEAASATIGGVLTFKAREVGALGDELRVSISGTRGGNALGSKQNASATGKVNTLVGLSVGDVVEVSQTQRKARFSSKDPVADQPVLASLRLVGEDSEGKLELTDLSGGNPQPATGLSGYVQKLELTITVACPGYTATYPSLSLITDNPRYIGEVLRETDPFDSRGRIYAEIASSYTSVSAAALLDALLTASGREGIKLRDGSDGAAPTVTELSGLIDGEPSTGNEARGLSALEEIDDIAIVAAPGNAGLTEDVACQALRDALLGHCERLRYRFAILSARVGDNNTEDIREVRAVHDSTYGALYYPWVNVIDPNGDGKKILALPPEGFMAGIYARSDIERGVHKAPANEIVRGSLDFTVSISHGTQEVLNPEGINCMRFFEGRGNRIWGARTLSSDPEWKYLNVRRLFIYMEHSIDKATQWAVFEPNNEALWKKITMTIESFLVDVWRTGALMGTSPKEAFFVRCDRSTMTQGDLDNGRLVCLIGVAPTKPAEFVIFRIGQWTADASTL